MERFYYPKKDANGKTTYEPTWKREIPRCYCVKKECILRRQKGMIEVQEDVRQQLKEGHKKLLKEVLHYSYTFEFIKVECLLHRLRRFDPSQSDNRQ